MLQNEEHLLKAELSPAWSWDSCSNVREMFLRTALNLAPENTNCCSWLWFRATQAPAQGSVQHLSATGSITLNHRGEVI